MNRLFIELYLDEDVNVLVADLIKARGFQATTVVGAGQRGKSDYEQLEYAVSQEKVLLTHNRVDFEALALEYYETGKMHCGIILAYRHPPKEILRRLLIILNNVTADEMHNQLKYI